jgi:signal peptide peptidase SppA
VNRSSTVVEELLTNGLFPSVTTAYSSSSSGETTVKTMTHGMQENAGMLNRWIRRVGSGVKTGFAVVGFAAVAVAYSEYQKLKIEDDDDDSKTKKVLVLPFHQMRLVERKDPRMDFQSLSSGLEGNKSTRTITMETRELVDLLHHAASDDSITSLYGIFGHGGTGIASSAGWAQLEEIRNALRIVKESHRRHPEPNLSHQETIEIPRIPHKPLYAYSDSFASLADPANKEYYLASVFTHIHMQQHGELNLVGMLSQQFFLRDLLEQYGIQFHVFKHGPYKNFPNMFTHNGLNKFHLENVTNIQKAIHQDVCQDITASRAKGLVATLGGNGAAGKGISGGGKLSLLSPAFDVQSLWKRIHEVGTFPAESAWKAGLIDYLPHRDPLDDLVQNNKNMQASKPQDDVGGCQNDNNNNSNIDNDDSQKEKSKEVTCSIVAKWKPGETDFERFKAVETIDIQEYANKIAKRKAALQRRQEWHEYLTETFPTVTNLLFSTDKAIQKTKENIALLYVTGAIGDEQARKLVDSIRRIRKDNDTKAVVMRISSPGGQIVACETILQELKSLEVPVVVSFGNVSASGGYYIASAANRIFSSRKTVTGSIGVFGIRMDLTGLATKYNIKVDHVATGELSGVMSPFVPMSSKMKKTMADTIDRYYDQFKGVVADGRRMPLNQVECIAQGRVWTGDQAKTNGLVDELGGLDRALAYARRMYTTTDEEAEIVLWPKKKSLFERLMEAKDKNAATNLLATAINEWVYGEPLEIGSNENSHWSESSTTAGNIMDMIVHLPTGMPGSLSGIMMTADENTAIQSLLNNAMAKQQNNSKSCWPQNSFWE